MIGFMTQIDKDLTESGELVFQQGLADASTAKTVGLTDNPPLLIARYLLSLSGCSWLPRIRSPSGSRRSLWSFMVTI
jgi:hypothetical protein